ncbi:restriction endonuclease subunit S [Glaesserella parasuis]|nr:restriction endonuclease subunit S [Glaesserella parasuis]MDP0120084.1 restriction endonuclease subunit S [Glaesserella parasuis]
MEFNKIQFPDTWNKYSLDDVCSKITSGGTPSRTKPEFYENGSINWVKTKELNNYYIYDTEEKITEEALKKSSAKLLPTNTILLAMYGATVGELGILSKEMACNQACCALITNPKICDYRYLFYLLAFHKEEIINLATGAAQQNISAKIIRELTFRFPDIDQQKEIVDVLNTLDKKIQLNTQINQTLEQIAQTIFKSWFIDFDPVHAKANALANGQTAEQATQAAMAVISGKNTQELHRLQTANPEQYQQLWEIAEAFPSGFDEEGVPRGWEMTVVKSVCEKIQNGGTPKRSNKEYWNNGNIPWLSSGEVCNNNILVSSKEFITQLGLENSSTKLIEANSTLVALYASPTAGKCSFCAFKATTNQAVCALVPKEIYKYFNFYYLQTKEEYYSNQAVGSAQQNISKGIVENTPIFKPDNMILSYFNLIVGGLMNKQISNLKENDHLKSIRDELLPKLLSGEILNGN